MSKCKLFVTFQIRRLLALCAFINFNYLLTRLFTYFVDGKTESVC